MQARKLSEKVQTSINLEKEHKEFLEKENLNLSAIVRDTIERLIRIKNNLRGERK